MMKWYQILSYFITNLTRLVLCLSFIQLILHFPKMGWKGIRIAIAAALFVTSFSIYVRPQFAVIGTEMILAVMIAYIVYHDQMRLCMFLIFFYEIGVALWEFIISTVLGILFESKLFITDTAFEYLITVWLVQALTIGLIILIRKLQESKQNSTNRVISFISLIGFFSVNLLGQQEIIPINDEDMTQWIIFSLVLMTSIIVFNLNNQYEMEQKMVRLKTEQVELMEREYQTLNQSYSANAKLFHDFHNHVEVMYRYLKEGKDDKALRYLEELRAPIDQIVERTWTGDEAIDYLINSKLALAAKEKITIETNIEFPQHMNIQSADLTAIIGNLLDNAMEAVKQSKESERWIHFVIRRINQMLVVKVENACEKQPILKDGQLITSKKDEGLHGWGLKSIQTAAQHYDGIVETTCQDHAFCTVVTLSYHGIALQEET